MTYDDEGASRTRRIRQKIGRPSRRVVEGIGDQSTIALPPRQRLIAQSEPLIEGVHFDLTYTTARELGHKALAVPLSGLAIRGAEPLYAMVSLGLTQHLGDPFLLEFFHGMRELARRHGIDIVSIQTVQSPTAMMINVTVIGQVAAKRFSRDGAKPGDLIAVSGQVGTSAAGLNCLKKLGRDKLWGKDDIIQAHLVPEPRVSAAAALLKVGGVTAVGHLSDSLSKELYQITERSEVGAIIDEKLLPISSSAQHAADLVDSNARAWALYGGEDYELLFTFRPAHRQKVKAALKKAGAELYIIGEVTHRRDGLQLRNGDGELIPLAPREWNHFVRRHRRAR